MIDVLLATYNGEKYLNRQIKTILKQRGQETYPMRLIVRDDGSTDNSIDVIEKSIAKYNAFSEIMTIFNEEPSGSARNNFLKLIKYSAEVTKGDYVMLSDQDDEWSLDKLNISMRYMEKYENEFGKNTPILLHSDLLVVAENGDTISESLIDYMNLPKKDGIKDLLLQNSVTGCSVIMNRAAADLVAKADLSGEFVIHDHFAAVLIATFGYVGFIKEPLVKYRQHDDNVIGAQNAKSFSYMFNRFLKGKERFNKDMMDCYKQAAYICKDYIDKSDIKGYKPKWVKAEKVSDSGESGNESKISRVYISDEEYRRVSNRIEVVEGFAKLADMTSSERRKYFIKNKMIKRGFIKAVMQLVWC